ncbi:MAG TPA: TVP38/TMEM64 family protein [Candidatus Binatia bacterium]|nr:TVP38/TMEM64 family protein [Candidatus Binatia bacterium]
MTRRSAAIAATVAMLVIASVVVGYAWWDGDAHRMLLRLYKDKTLMRQTLQEWGVLAPVVFIVIQGLQVLISPIPGEVTGFLGGYLFGLWPGFIYSSVGLTLGSLAAFGVGRWLGARFVRNLVRKKHWDRLGFIVEAEGAILCFIIYLIPGFPKDIVCYLFGISPMPLWVFALVSSAGRIPGTWVLSAQGARTATGHYWQAILLMAVVAAIALPLYYYRHQIMAWCRGSTPPIGPSGRLPEGLDTKKHGS